MIHNTSNGLGSGFSQWVTKTWAEFFIRCNCYAGKDGFNKALCSHKDNKSTSPGEKEGTMRCSILACPVAEKVYNLAKDRQRQESEVRDFTQKKPHLRLVVSNA